MNRKLLFRGLYILGIGAIIAALAACPNPVNTDFALEEGDGEFEIAHYRGSTPTVESEFFPSSRHLGRALQDFRGWSFTPTAKSEDGRLVVGDAVNVDGYSRGDILVEPGAKAAVYWVVGKSRRGRDPWISTPRVIGLADRNSLEGNWRARWRMMWKLNSRYGLLYLDKYTIYLETAVSVTDLETRYSYDVAGTIGSVTSNFVASFERLKVKAITALFSDAKDILSFEFPAEGWTSEITGTNILVEVREGSNMVLTPTIDVSEGAEVEPASGVEIDFTDSANAPVPYTVTAEDSSRQVYLVRVVTFGGGNTAPEVLFPIGDYLIIGAPVGSVNGEYVQQVTRKYYNSAGGFYLFYLTYDPGTGNEYYWVIHTTDTISSPDEATYIYETLLKFHTPLAEGWMYPDGTTPVDGMFVYGAPVTSDTQYYSSPPVGATLTAVYYYDDPDGDADASTFQWYELTNPSPIEFSPIGGATGPSYTLTGLEGGEIQVEVTAADSRGAVGNTALSRQVFVGGG